MSDVEATCPNCGSVSYIDHYDMENVECPVCEKTSEFSPVYVYVLFERHKDKGETWEDAEEEEVYEGGDGVYNCLDDLLDVLVPLQMTHDKNSRYSYKRIKYKKYVKEFVL